MGFGLLTAGAILLVLAMICYWGGKEALNQKPVHDGIGGKDTDNMLKGCLLPFAAIILGCIGAVLVIIGTMLAILI